MQLLIDHGLADFSWLLDKAVDDDCCLGHCCRGWFARPSEGADSHGGHKEVSNWRDDNESCNNMLSLAPSRGHPASLQAIDELHTMVGNRTDDASGGDIPEARQQLTRALSLARGIFSICPGARSWSPITWRASTRLIQRHLVKTVKLGVEWIRLSSKATRISALYIQLFHVPTGDDHPTTSQETVLHSRDSIPRPSFP